MSWPRRQLVQHFLAAMLFAVVAPHKCLASCLVHGQLTNEVQNGVAIARAYDSLNRPTGYSLMHDAQCTMHNGGGANPSTLQPFNLSTVTYSYDSLGRFSGVGFNAEAQRGRVDFEYSYLPGTDLVSGYTSGSFSRSVTYEPHRNLIAAITNAFTNPSTLQPFNLSTFAYLNDALGRRSSITRTGLAFGDLSGSTDAYGYNGRLEVISARRTMDGAEVRGFDYDYAYDPIGNRTSATDYDEQGNPLVSSYTANALNQYTQRTVPGYASLRGEAATNATVTVNERPTFRQGAYFYGGDMADNAASNLWKELEIYAAINPPGTNTPDVVYASTGTVFIARTPESFTYDADGNMTSDGRFHYFWNGENRLVCASNAEVVVTYAYDHRGRMVTKTLCASAPLRLIKNITYIWDDWNIIREIVREGDSVAVTDNIWGLDLDGTLQGAGGVGGLLAVVRDDGVFLPTYDANGNVSEYVSTNGEIVAHYDYSPFGEPLVASGSLAATFTHQFSTKPYCAVTGFSEYLHRMYLCETGRWLSKDIIEDIVEQIGAINPDGLMMAAYSKVIRGGADINLYAYCANDSLNSFDMLGLACTFVRYTQSVPWGGNAGIARTSGTIDYRNEVKICDKLCSPCETGKSIKQMSTIRVTGTAAFQLPIPLPPLVRIEFTFGIIGGGQFEHEVDACTGKTTSKGCAFYTVLAGLQGCAGSRYLGGEICLRGEGDLTHRWCADGTQETCMGAKVMMRTCFFSRCYDVIFFETPRKCW